MYCWNRFRLVHTRMFRVAMFWLEQGISALDIHLPVRESFRRALVLHALARLQAVPPLAPADLS